MRRAALLAPLALLLLLLLLLLQAWWPKAAGAGATPPAKTPPPPPTAAAPAASACPYTFQELRELPFYFYPAGVLDACPNNATTGSAKGCRACQCSAAAFTKILAFAITLTAEDAERIADQCRWELLRAIRHGLPSDSQRTFDACLSRDDAEEAAAACRLHDPNWDDGVNGVGSVLAGKYVPMLTCPLYTADELRESLPGVVARFAFDVDAAAKVADKRERCLAATCASATAARSVAKKYARFADALGGLTIKQRISCVAEVDSALPSDAQKLYQKINDDACAAVPELRDGGGGVSVEALCSGRRATPAWASMMSAAAAAVAARPLALAAAVLAAALPTRLFVFALLAAVLAAALRCRGGVTVFALLV